MERSRAAVLAPIAEWAAPDLGHPSVASLSERLEALRSAGVTQDDVTSFVEGLALPLGAGETPRHRADVLLDVLEDEHLSRLVTHEGFAVGPAALEALQSLGFPYALEVTPEMLTHAHHRAPTVLLMPGTAWGVALSLLSTLFMASRDLNASTFVTLLAPALAAALCRELGWSFPHRLFNCLQWVVAGPMLLVTGLMLWLHGMSVEGCLTLGFTLLTVLSAGFLYRGPPQES